MQQDYEEHHGEAVYALNRFVEALGGPPAPPRGAFPLPLKSDRVQEDPGPTDVDS